MRFRFVRNVDEITSTFSETPYRSVVNFYAGFNKNY